MEYPPTLHPNAVIHILLEGVETSVPVRKIKFREWEGRPIKNNLRKPLINLDGEPAFPELAIHRMAIQGGWSARWIQTYAAAKNNPRFLVEWTDAPLAHQRQQPIYGPYQKKLLEEIASANGTSCFWGCWDIFAWLGTSVLFIESKRKSRDGIREGQLSWVNAARKVGLAISNFMIVEWEFV